MKRYRNNAPRSRGGMPFGVSDPVMSTAVVAGSAMDVLLVRVARFPVVARARLGVRGEPCQISVVLARFVDARTGALLAGATSQRRRRVERRHAGDRLLLLWRGGAGGTRASLIEPV